MELFVHQASGLLCAHKDLRNGAFVHQLRHAI